MDDRKKLVVFCLIAIVVVCLDGILIQHLWDEAQPPYEVGDTVDSVYGVVVSNESCSHTIIVTIENEHWGWGGNHSVHGVEQYDVVKIITFCYSEPVFEDGSWQYQTQKRIEVVKSKGR